MGPLRMCRKHKEAYKLPTAHHTRIPGTWGPRSPSHPPSGTLEVTEVGIVLQPGRPSGAMGLPSLTRGEAASSSPIILAGGHLLISSYLVRGGRAGEELEGTD